MFSQDVCVDEDGEIFFKHRPSLSRENQVTFEQTKNIENHEANNKVESEQRNLEQVQSQHSPQVTINENPDIHSPPSQCVNISKYADCNIASVQNATDNSSDMSITTVLSRMTNVLTEMNSEIQSLKSSKQSKEESLQTNMSNCNIHFTQPDACSVTSHSSHDYDVHVHKNQYTTQGGEAQKGNFRNDRLRFQTPVGNNEAIYRHYNEANNAHFDIYEQNSQIDNTCHGGYERNQGMNFPYHPILRQSTQGVTPLNHTRRQNPFHDFGGIKMDSFKGESSWQVWHTRFEILTQRYGLTEDEKMDQLLPRIEGKAAEFLFTQLPRRMLSDYATVVHELNLRYRVIETPRSFAAKFSKRCQRVGETAEQYAAELKVLYDKAHGYRDRRVREEDLVRRFLDGLADDQVRFEIEYHKEPSTIDEAVFHVVNFLQTRSRRDRGRESLRLVGDSLMERNCNSDDGEKQSEKMADTEQRKENLEDLLVKLVKRLDRLEEQVIKKEDRNCGDRRRQKTMECFHCHEIGHLARECFKREQSRGINLAYTSTQDDSEAQNLNYFGPALAAREGSL